MTALVLASTSRYKRELLARLGLPFATLAPEVDESPRPDEPPAELALRLAAAKADRAAGPGRVAIGADQVAALDGHPLGKPGSHEAAVAQLLACQGRTVDFFTAVSIVADGQRREHVDSTRVRFRQRNRAELDRYLTLEPAYDCAGGFKSEGLGIALFEAIETTDPSALIGLPLIWIADTLREFGLDPLQLVR